MFDNFNLNVSKIFKNAELEMMNLGHPYVGSEHLLLSILKDRNKVSCYLKKQDIDYDVFYNEIVKIIGKSTKRNDVILYTPLLKRSIENAINDAEENNNGKVTPEHLMIGILEEGEGIALRLLLSLKVNIEGLYKNIKKNAKKNNKNSIIYEIGVNLTKKVDLEEEVFGREEEIILLVETLLRKNKNNPLLIGKAGVGKTAIVEELARRINRKQVPEILQDKEIILLNMGTLIAGTKYRGEFEERLTNIIEEIINNENIIIFIDEIHTLIGAGGAEGAIDASNILKPYLARGVIKCIGATTEDEYDKHIAKDKALERRFQVINILEPNYEETLFILKSIKPIYEKHHSIKITDNMIEEIVSLSNKYIYDKFNPDKCIDVLDSVCAKAKVNHLINNVNYRLNKDLQEIIDKKEKSIEKQDFNQAINLKNKEEQLKKKMNNKNKELKITKTIIYEVIQNKTLIPLLENKNKVINKIKRNLKTNIFGQDKAIDKIIDNLKTNDSITPLSFLFTGSSGIGKTESAKLISQGLNNKGGIIRLDMSEYALETSINKLIGVSAGYVGYEDETILNKVKKNPYSVILLDEIEKAHSQVLNLFLQILDEGFITNNKGEKVMFSNTIIIMTSNATTTNNLGFNQNDKRSNEYLSPELLNRITSIIEFQSIDLKTIKEYITINIKDISDKNLEELILKSDYKIYGLRKASKLIKNKKLYV